MKNHNHTGFFQMMRLLEIASPVAQKKIQLKASYDLQFPAHDIKSMEITADAIILTVAFMGIAGSQGGLPLHYTELLLQQSRHHDTALADFLDIFHHRSIELFYRSWQKHQFYIGYEKSAQSQENDSFTRILKSITGSERSLPSNNLALFHAGHYANPKHSATALSQILSHYFLIPARVLEWQGEWLSLPDEKCSALKNLPQNNCLGVNMIAGKKIWSAQHKIRIQLFATHKNHVSIFSPQGKAFQEICKITRDFIGPALKFDLQVIVKSKTVEPFQLTQKNITHLGWDIWLKSETMPEELHDIVLQEENTDE